MKTIRPVLVMQLPPRLNLTQAREFLPEVKAVLDEDRPRVVFDFSEVQQIDSAGIEMLLQCLDSIMELDGDLKLASVTPQAAVILQLTRADRLFEIFPTVDRAVESFYGFVTREAAQASGAWLAELKPGNGHAANGRIAS